MKKNITHQEAWKAVDYHPMAISSSCFNHDEWIPSLYTCEGININPSLDIRNIPEDAVSLVIIMDDPDALSGNFLHWIVWNIPVTHHIKENEIHGTVGLNDFHVRHYRGPCPPSGIHHYYFKVYALDSLLELPEDTTKIQLEKAMSSHIIGFGLLIGLYQKQK